MKLLKRISFPKWHQKISKIRMVETAGKQPESMLSKLIFKPTESIFPLPKQVQLLSSSYSSCITSLHLRDDNQTTCSRHRQKGDASGDVFQPHLRTNLQNNESQCQITSHC